MSSLIHELQQGARDSNSLVSDLLRNALIVARKLYIKEFEDWVILELKGYLGRGKAPDYRLIPGRLVVQNPVNGRYQDLIISRSPELARSLSIACIGSSIVELESAVSNAGKNTKFHYHFSKETENNLMKGMRYPLVPSIQLDVLHLVRILATVKTIILVWSLDMEAQGILGEGMSFTAKEEQLASANTYNIGTYIEYASNSSVSNISRIKEVNMRDNYNVGQAGAVGSNAHAHDMTFNQLVNQIENSIDFSALVKELSELRQAIKEKQDSSPQAAIAAGEIAKAEIAATEKNTPKVVEHLKAAGKWTMDFAKEIGKDVVVVAIKQSMGMP